MIIYSDWLVPRRFNAITIWPFIFVDNWHGLHHDPALLDHEMVHYREQAWITPIWWLRYAFSKSFRVNAEAKAYAVQVQAGGLTIVGAAQWLMKYDKELTIEDSIKLIESYYIRS